LLLSYRIDPELYLNPELRHAGTFDDGAIGVISNKDAFFVVQIGVADV